MLKQLKDKIFSVELFEFEAKISASRLSIIKLKDYYYYLIGLLKRRGLSSKEYTIIENAQNDFAKYHELVTLMENKVATLIFETGDQRMLYNLSQQLDIIKRLVKLTLTSEMYTYYQRNRRTLHFTHIANSIIGLALDYDIMEFPDMIFPEIEQSIFPAEEYYRLALERNAVLVNNTLEVMKNNNANMAVLVAGGFHSEGIATLLKEQEVSYMVVTLAK